MIGKGAGVRFEKWEGLGNDFVLLRDLGRDLASREVQQLCDRHFGIGADGVLLVETTGPVPRMVVRNADGSRPEMCGNGLRCVAGHLAELAFDGRLTVLTDAGEKACEVEPRGRQGYDVTVEMGAARAQPDLVATLAGEKHRFLVMDMGNPHAITFDPTADPTVDEIGPVVATLPTGGTNVEFCRVVPEGGPAGPARIAVTVWERGVGRTLACGTGACAVAAAACDTGRAQFGAPVVIVLPGGELTITVAPATRTVRMRGPARRVFTGEVVIA